jgi:hypothetical protein
MDFGFRVFLIDEEDKIIRIPTSRFDKIRNRDSKEALIQYKDSRIRYAMVGGILQKIICNSDSSKSHPHCPPSAGLRPR